MKKKWVQIEGGTFPGQEGFPPETCICGIHFESKAIDGKTRMGPWAWMCVNCHKKYGMGIGIGKGQVYMPDGKMRGE